MLHSARVAFGRAGGVDICRNPLDFYDMTVDKQGRVQVGYCQRLCWRQIACRPRNGIRQR